MNVTYEKLRSNLPELTIKNDEIIINTNIKHVVPGSCLYHIATGYKLKVPKGFILYGYCDTNHYSTLVVKEKILTSSEEDSNNEVIISVINSSFAPERIEANTELIRFILIKQNKPTLSIIEEGDLTD